jgi:hypothetical protein
VKAGFIQVIAEEAADRQGIVHDQDGAAQILTGKAITWAMGRFRQVRHVYNGYTGVELCREARFSFNNSLLASLMVPLTFDAAVPPFLRAG